MYSFSYLEPVSCSMSSFNYCFLTCIQISQEAGPITSWQINGEKNGNSDRLYFLWLQNSCSDCSHEIKTLAPWKKSYDKPRQCVKKQTHYFADKGLYGQSYSFCSSCVQMWELDHKEGWVPKNWSFQIVELEKVLWESLGQQGDQASQS